MPFKILKQITKHNNIFISTLLEKKTSEITDLFPTTSPTATAGDAANSTLYHCVASLPLPSLTRSVYCKCNQLSCCTWSLRTRV